jgi:hypothetical protein
MRIIMANDRQRGGTDRDRANEGSDQDYSSAGMGYAGRIGVGNLTLGNFNGRYADLLARYEREEEEDDYRHRMKMNVLGLLAAILLVISGTWIADTMAEVRRIQECFLAGGRNCAPIRHTGENIRQSSDLTASINDET